MDNPATFVRVSLPHGHFTVTAVAAKRGGWTALKQDATDADGRPLAPKPRVDVEDAPKQRRRKARTPKPRVDTVTATPTPTDPEAASGDSPEE